MARLRLRTSHKPGAFEGGASPLRLALVCVYVQNLDPLLVEQGGADRAAARAHGNWRLHANGPLRRRSPWDLRLRQDLFSEKYSLSAGIRPLATARCVNAYGYLFISSELPRSSAPALHCSPRSPTRADPPGVSAEVLASRGVTAPGRLAPLYVQVLIKKKTRQNCFF
jgi:hypothetical protein